MSGQIEIKLESGSRLVAVKFTSGWVLAEYGKEAFRDDCTYRLSAEPQVGAQIAGTFSTNFVREGRVGMTGSWQLESPVETITRQ